MLNLTGIFCNLEYVASLSLELYIRFLTATGYTPKSESKSKSDKLLIKTQLGWRKENDM
jgi:tRNA (cmo5U34)-methyltransferase